MAKKLRMQTLRKYLDGKPKAAFAVKVGIAPAYLSQIMSGHRTPSLDVMLRIQSASGGEVDLNSWSPENSKAADAHGAATSQGGLKSRAAS